MRVLALIFLASCTACGAALAAAISGDWLLLALPSAVGSLTLLLRALWRQRRRGRNWIVIDGSNVMHWRNNEPSIDPVRAVIAELAARSYVPGVVFDANAGYKLAGRYLNERALARMLDLPLDRIFVVPKGEPADPFILRAARDLGAGIVTNDRFRDWVEDHPEIGLPGLLIRGRYECNVLILGDVEAGSAGAREAAKADRRTG